MASYKYESDANGIMKIKLSDKKKAITDNAEPTGDLDSEAFVKISKNNFESGIRPRGVILTRTKSAGTGAAKVDKILRTFIPVLTKNAMNDAKWKKGGVHSYDGATDWKVDRQVEEDY